MGGPRAVLLCIKLLFEVGPKLRLLARLARLLSRSPVSILAPCGSTTELPAGCITSPNNAAPAPAETGPELEGCPKALLKSETKALDPDDVVPKPADVKGELVLLVILVGGNEEYVEGGNEAAVPAAFIIFAKGFPCSCRRSSLGAAGCESPP